MYSIYYIGDSLNVLLGVSKNWHFVLDSVVFIVFVFMLLTLYMLLCVIFKHFRKRNQWREFQNNEKLMQDKFEEYKRNSPHLDQMVALASNGRLQSELMKHSPHVYSPGKEN
jgi:hypothetical protein